MVILVHLPSECSYFFYHFSLTNMYRQRRRVMYQNPIAYDLATYFVYFVNTEDYCITIQFNEKQHICWKSRNLSSWNFLLKCFQFTQTGFLWIGRAPNSLYEIYWCLWCKFPKIRGDCNWLLISDFAHQAPHAMLTHISMANFRSKK